MDALGEINLRQVIFEERVKEHFPKLEGTISLLDKEVAGFHEQVQRQATRINDLEQKVAQLFGQKRQLDTLLSRWAREIPDVGLKQDFMRYIFGDIKCEESFLDILDPPSFVGGVDPARDVEEDNFRSPSPPLTRTRTCPMAPERVKKSKVEETIEPIVEESAAEAFFDGDETPFDTQPLKRTRSA